MTWEIDGTDYREPKNLLQRAKAIRAKCVECSGGKRPEVRRCEIFTCPLWPWRFGSKPRYETQEAANP